MELEPEPVFLSVSYSYAYSPIKCYFYGTLGLSNFDCIFFFFLYIRSRRRSLNLLLAGAENVFLNGRLRYLSLPFSHTVSVAELIHTDNDLMVLAVLWSELADLVNLAI